MENDSEIDCGEVTLVKSPINGLCEIEKHWFDDTKCQKTSGGSSLGESSLSSSNGSNCDHLLHDALLSSTSDCDDDSLFGYGSPTKCKTRINNGQNTCGVRDIPGVILVSDINKDFTMDGREGSIIEPMKTLMNDFSSLSLKRNVITKDGSDQVRDVNKDSTIEVNEVSNCQSMKTLRKEFAGLGLQQNVITKQNESSEYNDGSDQVETTLVMNEKPSTPDEETVFLCRKLKEELDLTNETRGPHPINPYPKTGHHQSSTNVNLRTIRGRNAHLPNQYNYNTQLETDDVATRNILVNHTNSTESIHTRPSCLRGPPDNAIAIVFPALETVDKFMQEYPTSDNSSRSVGVTLPKNPQGIPPLPSIHSFFPTDIDHRQFTYNGSGLSAGCGFSNQSISHPTKLMSNEHTPYLTSVQSPPICSDIGFNTFTNSSNCAVMHNMTNYAYCNPTMLTNNRNEQRQMKIDFRVSHTDSPVNQKGSRNVSVQSTTYYTPRNHEHPMGNIPNMMPGRTRSGSTSSQSSSSTYQSSIRSPGYPSDPSTAEMSPPSIASSHGSPGPFCDFDPNSPPSLYNPHNPNLADSPVKTRTLPLINSIPVPARFRHIPTQNNCAENTVVEDEPDSIVVEDESDTESEPDYGNNPLHDLSHITDPVERNSIINKQKCCPDFRKNIDALNKLNQTPLYLAVKCQNKDVCDYLLTKQANPTILCFRRDTRKIERSFHENALHLASEKGYYEIVEMLLKYYQGPNFIDSRRKGDGMTPLLLAIAEHSSTRRNHSNIIRILVEYGANLSIKDNKTGSLPLMLATKKHELKLVLELLDDLDAGKRREQVLEKDRSGNTYLHMAAQITNHNTTEDLASVSDSDIQDFCMRIVQYGGDVEAKNCEGLMPKDLRHNLMRQIR
ncbi:uncharacterized protein LOC126830258 [Patella vulgata]|uniref:uncharacterized protein LOC126830258 n=1 Tax=Patella vulgata TaxID=6465 RepID=UPI00217FBBC5|nr:uncharacterized protein LOC126830258 [Patella vulgata]XP_050416573.1 uncharacterized protein LOC126830258 [Patella vulgata]